MEIVQSLEDSNILIKGVTKTIENKINKPKGGFLSMLLGILGASSLRNLLTGKGIVRAGSGRPLSSASQNKKWKGIARAGYIFLMPLHPLTNFEIQKYYQYEPRLNGVFSRDNLPKNEKIKNNKKKRMGYT